MWSVNILEGNCALFDGNILCASLEVPMWKVWDCLCVDDIDGSYCGMIGQLCPK